jgi:hypothetical protein
MKRSTRSIRRYRDSQAKLILAKRRYQDALRRYRDAEVEEKASKFKALKDKIDEKFAMYVKDHPEDIKFYKKFSILSTQILGSIGATLGAGVSGASIGILAKTKGNAEELKKLGMSLGGVIGSIIVGLASVALSFIGIVRAEKAKNAMKENGEI